jgi:hypothetical protein
MWIIVVYVSIVVISELIVVAIGLVLDRIYPIASLPVSMSLFCFALVACLGSVKRTARIHPNQRTA